MLVVRSVCMSVTYLNPRRQPPADSQHTMPKLMAQRINLLAKMRRKPIQDDANEETQLGCRFKGPSKELQNLFESVRTLLPILHQSFIICCQCGAQIVEAASRGSMRNRIAMPGDLSVSQSWTLVMAVKRALEALTFSATLIFANPFIPNVRSALMALNHKGFWS